jgi:hypothetical protein
VEDDIDSAKDIEALGFGLVGIPVDRSNGDVDNDLEEDDDDDKINEAYEEREDGDDGKNGDEHFPWLNYEGSVVVSDSEGEEPLQLPCAHQTIRQTSQNVDAMKVCSNGEEDSLSDNIEIISSRMRGSRGAGKASKDLSNGSKPAGQNNLILGFYAQLESTRLKKVQKGGKRSAGKGQRGGTSTDVSDSNGKGECKAD